MIYKKLEIKIPMVPNFISVGDNESQIPIKDFTEKELGSIGKEWTKELIKKAKKKNTT